MLTVLLVAALPVAGQVIAARHEETRVKAAEWLNVNVPGGAFVMREWDMVQPTARHFDFNRRLYDLWREPWTPELVSRNMDFVVTTSTSFERVRRPGGWYALEVMLASSGAAPLEVGLGNTRKLFQIEGEDEVVVRAFLRRGKNWWRVGASPAFGEGDELTVLGVRLVRLTLERTRASSTTAIGASAEPPQPKTDPGGKR